MLGMFCWFAVVSTPYCRLCRVLVVCGVCLAEVGAVLVRAPPLLGVLCLCVPPSVVGRAVLVCASARTT